MLVWTEVEGLFTLKLRWTDFTAVQLLPLKIKSTAAATEFFLPVSDFSITDVQLHITYIKEIHFKDSHYWKYPTRITNIQQQKHVMAPHDVLVMGYFYY